MTRSSPRDHPSLTSAQVGLRSGRRRDPGCGDIGASYIDYAAVIMLVALLVAAVIRVSPPDNVADGIRDAMCNGMSIVTGQDGCESDSSDSSDGSDDSGGSDDSDPDGSGDDDQASDEPNFDPEFCIRDAQREETGAEVNLGVFTLGKKYYYAKETLSDGTVVVTMLPKAEAGVESGAGAEVEFGENSLDKTAEGDTKARLEAGNMFFLRGEEEGETGEEQFQRLEDDIAQAQREDVEDMSGDPGYQMGRAIGEMTGHYEPPDLPPVDVKTGTFGLEGNLEAPINRWRTNAAGTPEGNLKINPKVDVAKWYDNPDYTRTAKTYTFSAEGDIGSEKAGQMVDAQFNGGASWSGATRVMRRDNNDSIENIRYSVTASGDLKVAAEAAGGNSGKAERKDAVTQEVQIDFDDTPEDQAKAEQLLEERGLKPPENVMGSMVNPLMDDKEGGEITQPPGEDAKPYEQHFYDQGRVWQYRSDVRKTEMNFGAKAKMGISFGATFGWSKEDASTVDAQILEGPQNGERQFVRHEPCIAEEHRGGN